MPGDESTDDQGVISLRMLTAYLGFAFDEVGVALGVTLLASFILAMAAITRPVQDTSPHSSQLDLGGQHEHLGRGKYISREGHVRHLLTEPNSTLNVVRQVGTYMWFKSLTIREYTGTKWKRLSRAEQAYLQDKVSQMPLNRQVGDDLATKLTSIVHGPRQYSCCGY